MARPYPRKRRKNEPFINAPTKRIRIEASSEDPDSWQYPPEFWDRLSRVPLTQRALEELDRRNAVGDPEQRHIPTAEEAAVDEYRDHHLG
jgi:hypothetical protein